MILRVSQTIRRPTLKSKVTKMPLDQSPKVIYCPINTLIYYHLWYVFFLSKTLPTTRIPFLLHISNHWLERQRGFPGNRPRTSSSVRFVGRQANPIKAIRILPQQDPSSHTNPFLRELS